jgi:aminoglycoside 3-N-acetyltransferase
MPEAAIIDEKNLPVTKERIRAGLISLGVRPGMTVILHSSLKSIGWVLGREVSVIDALLEVLSPEGTLVMPAHSGEYSDPANWNNPAVPSEWLDIIKAEMPVFRPAVTPSRNVGIIPETFRKYPGVLRSNHPCVSFAAWGKNAGFITANHSLSYSFGENSPLARIYELAGYILLVGVGYDTNTSLHFAEARAGKRSKVVCGAPALENGQRVWKEYLDFDYDTGCFTEIGGEFEKHQIINRGNIGYSPSKLIKQRELIDFSVKWFHNH